MRGNEYQFPATLTIDEHGRVSITIPIRCSRSDLNSLQDIVANVAKVNLTVGNDCIDHTGEEELSRLGKLIELDNFTSKLGERFNPLRYMVEVLCFRVVQVIVERQRHAR